VRISLHLPSSALALLLRLAPRRALALVEHRTACPALSPP